MRWQHRVQVSLLIAMSRVCNITLLACFPRCTARNKVPPLSNDFSQAPCTSPRLIPPSVLYAFKLSRKPIYPQIKVQHRCGAGFQCIRGRKKNRAITWKERTMGIVLIAGVWVREPSRHEQTPSLSLHWEKEEDMMQCAEKKTSFPEVKRNWHIPKSVERWKRKSFFFQGGKPCRFITSWAWKTAFQLRTARFQWGFLCCLCFGCRCAASWDILGKKGLWDA